MMVDSENKPGTILVQKLFPQIWSQEQAEKVTLSDEF